MAVIRTSDGWTQVAPSGDSRIIYVSSAAGNDGNDGSEARPVKTLARAVGLTRAGTPDHILLKRGNTWTESLDLRNGGRSASEPAFVGSYGTGARPAIRGSSESALTSSGDLRNVVISDLQLVGPGNGAENNGIGLYSIVNNLLIENVRVTGFGDGIVIQPLNGFSVGVTIRRSTIDQNWKLSGHTNGAYIEGVQGLTIEQTISDANGWMPGRRAPDKFCHNWYIQDDTGSRPCSNVRIIDNISLRPAAQGFKLAPTDSTYVVGNLVVGAPIGIFARGAGGTMEDNVVVEGIWKQEALPGWGFTGLFSNVSFRNNIVAHVSYPADGYPVAYDVTGSPSSWTGNAAYNWPNEDGKPANKTGGFPDPTRNLTTYAQVMGYADIFAALRMQERGAYNERLTAAAVSAWIRAGYGFGDAPPPPPPPPVEVNIDSLIVRRTDGTTQTFKPYKPPAKAAAIKQINVVYSDGTIAEPFRAA